MELVASFQGSQFIPFLIPCLSHPPKNMAVVVKTVLGSHFGVGEFTTHFRTYFSGDWDVHWGTGF